MKDIFNEKNIKPMLLEETYKPFNDKNYIYELKFDGIRALIYVSKKDITIISRRGNILNKTFPELLEIKNNITNKCIFDGEIVLMEDSKPSFQKLQERMRLKNENKINYYKENYPVTFVCFDILYENKDLTKLPLIKRKEILSHYEDNNLFIKSKVVEDGIKLFNFVKKNNLEGIVAKLKTSEYIIGKRTKNWLKVKNIKEDDYIIGAYQEKEFVITLAMGKLINNQLHFISKVTIGKKHPDYQLIKLCKKTKNKFLDFNEEDYIYIEPKYTCTIIYLEKTKDGHLRHPVFKNIRNN